MSSVQKQNPEMNDLLRPTFAGRGENNFAVGNLISNYLMLRELRAFWPFSSIDENGNALDLSGQGRTLANTGTVTRSITSLVPYAVYSGANYYSRADEAGLDITGALTFGGWFNLSNIAATRSMISKYTAAGNQVAYALLYSSATGNLETRISTTGAAYTTCQSSVAPASVVGKWIFAVARFTPSVELAIWISNVKNTLGAGIPATIFNSSAALMLGGINAAAAFVGNSALCFLCAAALSDAVINNLYEQSRAALGL